MSVLSRRADRWKSRLVIMCWRRRIGGNGHVGGGVATAARVMGKAESGTDESFSAANDGLLEYPHYTARKNGKGAPFPIL